MDTPKRIGPGSFRDFIWLSRDEATDLIDTLAAGAAEVAGDPALWAVLVEREAMLTDKLVEDR